MELLAVERPASTAPSVAQARQALEDVLRLSGIPNRLAVCAERLSAARAVAAPYAQVRARLAEAAAALARASERARAVCSTFAGAARDSLEDLDDARDLLASDSAAGAAAALAASRARAKHVAAAARGVARELEAAASRVAEAESCAQSLRAAQEDSARTAGVRAAAARSALAEARDRRAMAADNVREASALYKDAVRRERTARTRANVAQAAQLAAVVGAAAGAKSPKLVMMSAAGVGALCKAAEAGVMRVREEKAVYLAQKMKARDRQLDVSKAIEGLTAELRTAGEEAVLDKDAVAALADVVLGLRATAAAFLDAEGFWGRVTTFTESTDGTPVEELMRQAAADDQARTQLCNSAGFARRLTHAYTHWVALQQMCSAVVNRMDATRTVLYRSMAASDDALPRIQSAASVVSDD